MCDSRKTEKLMNFLKKTAESLWKELCVWKEKRSGGLADEMTTRRSWTVCLFREALSDFLSLFLVSHELQKSFLYKSIFK